MHNLLLATAFFGLLISCEGSSENLSDEELEDTVFYEEIFTEDMLEVEEGQNEFIWIEDVETYEGKDPDSHISLALMITGVRDTLDLFTIWSFPEEVSDETKSFYGYPENVVASKGNYSTDEFIVIREKSTESYSIVYGGVSNDTIWTNPPIGGIELKNGMIKYHIDFPADNGIYYKFGESSPWSNFE